MEQIKEAVYLINDERYLHPERYPCRPELVSV